MMSSWGRAVARCYDGTVPPPPLGMIFIRLRNQSRLQREFHLVLRSRRARHYSCQFAGLSVSGPFPSMTFSWFPAEYRVLRRMERDNDDGGL